MKRAKRPKGTVCENDCEKRVVGLRFANRGLGATVRLPSFWASICLSSFGVNDLLTEVLGPREVNCYLGATIRQPIFGGSDLLTVWGNDL